MNLQKLTLLSSIFLVTACGEAAKAGEECTSNDDCADGLECHMHEGETDHGTCEEHEEHEGEEHEGEDHEGEEETAE